MVEGARLESVYTGNRIAGSNPAPSAMNRARPPTRPVAPFAMKTFTVSRRTDHRRARWGAAAALAACLFAGPVPAAARERRDGVADALAGHRAEMRQLDGTDDPWRRPLFYDPVSLENAPAGVPCDHLAERRPEVVAGKGEVLLFETLEASPRRLRFWRAPGAREENGEKEARHFVRAQLGAIEIKLLARRVFSWCH